MLIIKEKNKKGYVEIELVQANVGSDVGKAIVQASTISEDTAKKLGYTVKEETKSSLHPAVQSVVRHWFGSIEQFVTETLDSSRCALGQLSLNQINKGRDLLLEARKLVSAGARDTVELNSISSRYYSNIPMNFGFRKLDADSLRFDTDDKLDRAFDTLDTLENAKDVEKVLTKKNAADEQYRSLKTEMEWLNPIDPQFRWIDTLFNKTRASNHSGLGRLRVSNVFRLTREREHEMYMGSVQNISKQNIKRDIPELIKNIWHHKPTEKREYEKNYNSANILPLFHGTRTENMIAITKSTLKFRKPGFTVSGAMFDKGSGIYLAKGSSNKGYLFLSDVCLGNQKIASGAYSYDADNIKPNHSVWAKGGGISKILNDEFIVYTETQHWLKYIVEVERD